MKTRFPILVAWCLLLGGCVEQKMTITSEPSGAIVRVSDVEVGRTPVTIPIKWIGDYDVVLRLEGYQTLKTHAALEPTLYEIPPFDLFAELSPQRIVDQRYLHYKLEKQEAPSNEQLIQRAREMREENLKAPAAK